MEILYLILFLQIVLESLPISSSGHIFIIKQLSHLGISGKAFMTFDHFSHGPTLLIIAVLFWPQWKSIFRSFFISKRMVPIGFKLIRMVFVVEVITGMFYWLFKVLLADAGWFSSEYVLWVGLMITIGALCSLRWLPVRTSYATWNIPIAVVIGCVQGFALLPGISRFGLTYVVGRWFGLSARRAFEISFLIQVPLIAAAFSRASFVLVFKAGADFDRIRSVFFSWHGVFVLVLATLGGYAALSFARRCAYDGSFWRFGIYVMVLLGVLLVQ